MAWSANPIQNKIAIVACQDTGARLMSCILYLEVQLWGVRSTRQAVVLAVSDAGFAGCRAFSTRGSIC